MIESKFKNTELGPIPEDWDVTPISKCLSFGNGRDYKHLDSGIYPVYGTGGLITHINDFLYEGESVCIGRKGSIDKPQFHSGRFWTVDTLYYTHSFNYVIPKYVYYCFLCINWRSLNEASGVPSLSQRIIGGQYIRVASSVYEQRKIAEALSDIDALIRELNTLIEKKRALMQGAMQDLLTARRRVHGFDEPWKEETVDNICIRFDNLRIPVAETLRKKGNIPYYGANGIQDYVDGFTHDGEYILLAEDGANNLIDYPIRYVKGKIWVNNHAHVLQGKSNKADTRYLSYGLKTIDFESNIVGNGRAKLNAKTLMDLRVVIPSTTAEQIAIAEVLSDMDDEIETLESKRDKYIAVRQGMMQKLLTGKIRLI